MAVVGPRVNRKGESFLLNVFLTVDTELWPRVPVLTGAAIRHAMERDIYGRTARGEYGIEYQVRTLNEFGLRAVFLVEALSAGAVGVDVLREIVGVIEGGGQEVQMHVHPEWLKHVGGGELPQFAGPGMKDYTLAEQSALIARGLFNLAQAGVGRVQAFRAGGYGANLDTLGALAQNGIAFDTSYNHAWLGVTCDIKCPLPLHQAARINGMVEVPVSHFRDYPGHVRHAEICACSSGEMQRAIEQAWRRGWRSFVIVSHSFELLQPRREPGRAAMPARVSVGRFQRLCEYLAANRDRYRTTGFADLAPDALVAQPPQSGLTGSMFRTGWRMAEQLAGRWL